MKRARGMLVGASVLCLAIAAACDRQTAAQSTLPAVATTSPATPSPATPSPADAYGSIPPSPDGIGKTYMDREIAQVMGHLGAGWLERGERQAQEGTDVLLANLDLKPTDVVADVGAGTGYFSFPIARRVPRGRVLAVDIQPEMLAIIGATERKLGLDNVEPVLGTIEDPKLPAGAVNLVLLVDAYHEFDHPREMMTAIAASLAPGGRVVLVEYRGEDDGVPIKPLHKMTQDQAVREMRSVGLAHVETRDVLPWQHLMVFRRADDATNTTTQPASRPTTRTADDVAHVAALGGREVRVHDPSTILRSGARYYAFCTGQGVVSLSSPDLLTWTRDSPVFERPLDWFAEVAPGNRGYLWAPDVIRADDAQGERWLLYYSVSAFGKNTSAIALAVNRSLDPASPAYRWTDAGIVVRSRRADRFNAIDPAVTRDADGRLWMAFGSFWDGVELIELDAKTGLRKSPDAAPTRLANAREIEASYLYEHAGKYYLFVNHGLCCRGVRSTYEIRVGRADKITGPYVDRDGKPLLDGGGTPVLASEGPMIGPGHAGIVRGEKGVEQFSFHFYDGTDGGKPKLGIRPLTWDAEGWPVVTTGR